VLTIDSPGAPPSGRVDSAESAIHGLYVDPGAYSPWIARLMSGYPVLAALKRRSYSCCVRGRVNRLGS